MGVWVCGVWVCGCVWCVWCVGVWVCVVCGCVGVWCVGVWVCGWWSVQPRGSGGWCSPWQPRGSADHPSRPPAGAERMTSAVRQPMRGRASWQASASGRSGRPIASRGNPDSACGNCVCACSGCAYPLARRSKECSGRPFCSWRPTSHRPGAVGASEADAWAATAAGTRPRLVSVATRADGEVGWIWNAIRDWEGPLTLRIVEAAVSPGSK